MDPRRVVLLGPPGSGKGTQGVVVAERLGVRYVSTGERLRAEADAGTELGRQVASYLDSGQLVPDDLIVALVEMTLATAVGYVLDGFPRTLSQAEQADSIIRPDVVVYLDVPNDVARRRLMERTDGRSDDADPEVIERRLRIFHAESGPLLDYYDERGIVARVDAAKPPDEVTDDVLSVVTG